MNELILILSGAIASILGGVYLFWINLKGLNRATKTSFEGELASQKEAQEKNAAQLSLVRTELAETKTELQITQAALNHLNLAYSESRDDLSKVKGWYEESLVHNKAMQDEARRLRDVEKQLRDNLAQMTEKFYTEAKTVAVFEEKFASVMRRVEALETETNALRDQLTNVTAQRDHAAGKLEGAIEALVKLGLEDVVRSLIKTESVGTIESVNEEIKLILEETPDVSKND